MGAYGPLMRKQDVLGKRRLVDELLDGRQSDVVPYSAWPFASCGQTKKRRNGINSGQFIPY